MRRLTGGLHLRALAGLVLVIGATGATPRGTERPCEIARRWVESHAWAIPTTLERFSRYPLLYRRVAYDKLNFAQRRSLWREHLESFLGPQSKLTQGQQGILRYAISRLDQYIEAPARSHAALERDGFTIPRMRAQFGDSLARTIFFTLGPDEPRLASVQGVRTSLPRGNLKESATNKAAQLPDCSCNIGSDWCSSGSSCNTSNCRWLPDGCGTLWCYSCNGACYQNPS